MGPSASLMLKRQTKLGFAALAVLAGTGGLAAAVPVVRHRAEHLAANVLRHVHPHKTVVAKHGTETVKTVKAEIPRPDRDARFAAMPAATVAAGLGLVDPTGMITLDPAVSDRSLGRTLDIEHASVTTEPGQALVTAGASDAEFASARQALLLYRKGSIAAGDDFVRTINSPVLKTALEWVAIRFNPQDVGLARLQAFSAAHPDWPTLPWVRRRIEENALRSLAGPAAIRQQFAHAKPQTFLGQMILARADHAIGDDMGAAGIIHEIWRNADLTAGEESSILKEFGQLLTRTDYKFRADRLLYKEQVDAAMRSAALAGPDVKLLASARAAVIRNSSQTAVNAALAAVPQALANDPGLVFAKIQQARRSNRITDALALMIAAPTSRDAVIDGDAWWVERRLLARKLLDLKNPQAAYDVSSHHAAISEASLIEAEFHAGWIALRFLDNPKTALDHFGKAAEKADTPISKARVTYWQGRAADALHDSDQAKLYFAAAAAQPISFYGQLASAELGHSALDLHRGPEPVAGDDRREAIRVVEALYGLDERSLALPLAFEIAKTEPSEQQVAALAAILTRAGDARGTLMVGKFATQRGLALDDTAFPTFGVPDYQPLANSADRAVVYAIARQESEFDQKSVSSAGAKGLMQLITPTARETAQKCGLTYDDAKLLNDASFNARIGAAHLGQLLSEQRGSYILTFAAYNAGSQRVKDWIQAYGDPRQPGVDPVDWIERIPFTETRNYVQRVFENLQVYRARLGNSPKLLMVGAEANQDGKGT